MVALQNKVKLPLMDEPLGVDNVKAMREFLGWESGEAFYVPQEVYDN